jgi:hypothetical protein
MGQAEANNKQVEADKWRGQAGRSKEEADRGTRDRCTGAGREGHVDRDRYRVHREGL